ncbi:hypothetical protein M501DRAFT_942727 [Patellaria atrata CBS 101060]|uniref:Uncharacterized protein n=1 Tax=Patellaria atrata CBS 101060 TaxID=1346257 RepID=A0A9P4S2I5_9PEZI|nr:hypothetical protein M501DRAFT_942727 [Patellaria atrata CBS 101060]
MVYRREVPQEHSHQPQLDLTNTFLKLNNPDGIVDAVFGLLGNAAASAGLGNIEDPDCLQQATADRAFTNAKEAGDIEGMTTALIFRALERNTGQVGLKSVLCTSLEAVNPEIAALTQHQDPASDNAAEENKAITLELARQIASIGGDPQDALKAGTFAPGDLNDATAAGNTCNDENDAAGCIFSQNLLVPDATPEEIDAAVADIDVGAGAGNAADQVLECPAPEVDAGADANADNAQEEDAAADNAADDAATGGIDFGNCDSPAIIFAAGLDGRKENSFAPANQDSYTHGSALNIGVITSFIQDRLKSNCEASQAAIDAAARGAQAAAALAGQAAADAFNDALGVSA